MRTFIALELSDAAKAGILACVEQLRKRGIRASWSRSSTIHLTLRFLGDVDEESLDDVIAAVADAAGETSPFVTTTSALGAFPSPARPRVVWAGMEAPDELYKLQERLEEHLARAGFKRERRRFHPHVTLGRLRDHAVDLSDVLRAIDVTPESTSVASVRLMKSDLAPSGAVHEVIREFPFGRRNESPLEQD